MVRANLNAVKTKIEEVACQTTSLSFDLDLAILVMAAQAEGLALKHDSRILGQWNNPVSGSRKRQSMGQTVQNLNCSIMEKPHIGLDECPRIVLSCFRAMNSAFR